VNSPDEIAARRDLDEAIRAYSAVFDADGTVGAWAIVFERSALFPDDEHEPLRYAHTYTSSIGASGATVLGLLQIGSRLVERMTVGGMEEDES